MKLNDVILHLRQYCPSFASRVSGAAEFSGLTENSSLTTPCAYVIPLDEAAQEERGQTGYRQIVSASFGVVVVCSSRADERGHKAAVSVEALKAELFKALLCWSPDETQDIIRYEGGRLLNLDRSRMFYQFEFGYQYQINIDDTWQGVTSPDDEFKTVDLKVKGINADPQGTQVAHAVFNLETED